MEKRIVTIRFFPRPPFSGSGKIFASAIAIWPLRAWRKFGELSAKLEGTGPKGGRPKKRGNVATISPPTKKQVLAELGVNERHANRCEKLAEENKPSGTNAALSGAWARMARALDKSASDTPTSLGARHGN
ncbi:MAG: hypothetical protein ACREV4_08515 [Gammaproteobacteria bacterium]